MHIKKQRVRFKKILSLFIAVAFAISAVVQAAPFVPAGDNYLRTVAATNARIVDEITRELKPSGIFKVLDMGCGDGSGIFLAV